MSSIRVSFFLFTLKKPFLYFFSRKNFRGLKSKFSIWTTIDFEKKWKTLQAQPDFDPGFYVKLYKALSKNKILDAAQYPDPTDAHLNTMNKTHGRKNRQNRLIIFLASIRKSLNERWFAPGIQADEREGIPFSTSGNRDSWFHDKRYKLYRIFERLPGLTDADLATLLSNFLHAGQHCNVAKRWQIDDSFRLFAPEAAKALEAELLPPEATLLEKVVQSLAAEKHQILSSKVKDAIDREKDRVRLHGEFRHSLAELEAESATYSEATWDAWAHNFGLQERQCPYMSYKLSISSEQALGKGGGYTPKRIYDVVLRNHEKEFKEEIMGHIQHIIKDPEAILIAFLHKHQFIVEKDSSMASVSWSPKGSDQHNLRPQPASPVQYNPPPREIFSPQRIPVVSGHSLKQRFGVCENGRIPQEILLSIRNIVQSSQAMMSQEHFEDIVSDPYRARNDQERLAALSAREMFILVDRSGSMNARDEAPSSVFRGSWTRWDSAKVATKSFVELALSLDPDTEVQIMLWDGALKGRLNSTWKSAGDLSDVDHVFNRMPARGSTPLAEALTEAYRSYWKTLLQRSEPFSVIILTDGAPNDARRVKKFFKAFVRENHLERPGRETLATFSFVQIGDDHGATYFLQDLDDNLIDQMGIQVDLTDVKEDSFLFGTGRYHGRAGIGPFSVLWDAIYD